jgi:hypothetical protein
MTPGDSVGESMKTFLKVIFLKSTHPWVGQKEEIGYVREHV